MFLQLVKLILNNKKQECDTLCTIFSSNSLMCLVIGTLGAVEILLHRWIIFEWVTLHAEMSRLHAKSASGKGRGEKVYWHLRQRKYRWCWRLLWPAPRWACSGRTRACLGTTWGSKEEPSRDRNGSGESPSDHVAPPQELLLGWHSAGSSHLCGKWEQERSIKSSVHH